MTRQMRGPSISQLKAPASLLLLCVWVAMMMVHPNDKDSNFFGVEAFGLLQSRASPAFSFPKSSFLESSQRQIATRTTKLGSTSASAAYLESISYRSPSVEDGLLGATSKYLDALSSVQSQLYTTSDYYAQNSEVTTSTSDAAASTTASQVKAALPNPDHVPFTEDQLVNEVVQRVTQEFSSALEAFAGETYDSFLDNASTMLADSTPAYIWDLEEAADKGRKGAANVNVNSDNASPEETLRELTTKLDNTFRSFKENLATSTHSVTNSFGNSFRNQASQPNAAVQAAKQDENLLGVKQKIEEGSLTPDALTKEAANLATSVANKAIVESASSALELEKQASATTSAISKSLSETASSASATLGDVTSKASSALAGTQEGLTKSIESLVTNSGMEKVWTGMAKTTSAATSSIAETTHAAASNAMGSIGAAGSAITSGASSAAASVQSSVGAVGASVGSSAKAAGAAIANGASAAATNVQTSAQALGSSAKAAVVTASPGTAATTGKVSAVALSGAQGFGMPGNAYSGGGDVAGMIEMVAATIVSIPRALMDATVMETNMVNPNGMDNVMKEVSSSLTQDILVPISAPLQQVAATQEPLEQAQAVLQSLQMVLGLVVGIPRAALEGLTGQTIGDIQSQISQTDVTALAEQLSGFASAVSTVLVSLLKVVAQAISVLVTQATGVADPFAAAGQAELVSKLVSFVVEDLLPAILDALFLILQQFAILLMEGGSFIVGTM